MNKTHKEVFGGYLIILGILVLLFLACAPKPPELPKHYVPPESTEEDLEIEDALDMVKDLVQDTGETEENE